MRVYLMEFLGGLIIILFVIWLLWKQGLSNILWVRYWLKRKQMDEVNNLAKDASTYDQEQFKKNKDAVEKILTDDEENPNSKKGDASDEQPSGESK